MAFQFWLTSISTVHWDLLGSCQDCFAKLYSKTSIYTASDVFISEWFLHSSLTEHIHHFKFFNYVKKLFKNEQMRYIIITTPNTQFGKALSATPNYSPGYIRNTSFIVVNTNPRDTVQMLVSQICRTLSITAKHSQCFVEILVSS